MVELLLDLKDVSVNARDGSQLTSLHWTCIHGNEEVCKLLLCRKADILAKSVDLMTPLHFAVLCGNPAIAKLILKEGRVMLPFTITTHLTRRCFFHNALLFSSSFI